MLHIFKLFNPRFFKLNLFEIALKKTIKRALSTEASAMRGKTNGQKKWQRQMALRRVSEQRRRGHEEEKVERVHARRVVSRAPYPYPASNFTNRQHQCPSLPFSSRNNGASLY